MYGDVFRVESYRPGQAAAHHPPTCLRECLDQLSEVMSNAATDNQTLPEPARTALSKLGSDTHSCSHGDQAAAGAGESSSGVGASSCVMDDSVPDAPVSDTQQIQCLIKQVDTVLSVCATVIQEVPVLSCCNNPACTNLSGLTEASLVTRKCSKCRAAGYCNAECLKARWPQHKAVCKRLQKQ
eukprot:jgi/Chrzof1/8640/Cz03g18170.t1